MKAFRRFWVRSASLARAIIGCCEPMQADTVRRARLIRARAAEAVGPVWARGASAVRFWLRLGRANAGCCGSVFVPSPRVTRASWRFAALRFVAWPLLFVTWILSLVALRLRLVLHAACGLRARSIALPRCTFPIAFFFVSSPKSCPDFDFSGRELRL